MFKRISFTLFAVAVIPFAVLASSSCGSATGGAGGGSGGGSGGGTGGGSVDAALTCDASPTATTFHKVYTDVFSVGAPACTSCHLPNSPDGSGTTYGLYDTEANALKTVNKLSIYGGSAKTLKIIDPGHPENSSLYLKVLGRAKSPGGNNVGAQMPNGGTAVTAAQLKTLKDWICSGAAQ